MSNAQMDADWLKDQQTEGRIDRTLPLLAALADDFENHKLGKELQLLAERLREAKAQSVRRWD